jgi:hypothetical protein
VEAALVVIVAMEGYVDRPGWDLQPERRVQALGNPDATGMNANQGGDGRIDMGPHCLD